MKLLRFIVSFILLSVPLMADTWSTSRIQSDVVWTKNNNSGDGVWVVDVSNDSLIVEQGATLTIEPGVTVKFHGDVLFLVYGALKAQGTNQDSIIFTVDDAPGSAGEWSGIKLLSDSNTVNQLIYCRIEKGKANIVTNNPSSLEENGGGIYCGQDISSLTEIRHCTIQNNNALDGGGGIFIAGRPKVEFNLIRYNSAGQYGGGVALRGPSIFQFANPLLKNNLILHNTANGQGGGGIGIYANANLTMVNDLIYDNSAPSGSGGGLFIYSSSSLVNVKNAIIRANSASSSPQIFGVPNVTYSNVEGGYNGDGNIDADPQFADAANDDFHFEANSPVVDAGTNSDAPAVDFDGENRPFDGDRDGVAVVDMGPFEYQNTPPQITSTPVTEATEDQLYTYQVVAQDPDVDEVLTYSLVQGPSFLSMDAQTGLLSGTPQTNADAGAHTVIVQVSDLNNATDTQTFTLNVTAVNDAPVVSDIPDQTIDEGGTFAQINLNDYVSDEDNTDGEITWTYSGNSELSVTIDANNIATINTPDSNWFGSETITFTATDPGGLSDQDTAKFTVNAVNDAPVVSDIPDQTIDEGQSFVTIPLDDYVTDVDNSKSELTWTYSGNQDLNVSISSDHVATITTPDSNWFGTETITFRATDPEGAFDEDGAVFTVNNINDAPVAQDDAATTDEDVAVTIDVLANDSDVDGDSLTVSAVGQAAHGSVVVDASNRLVYTPQTNWNGTDSFTYTVSDGNGGSDQATVQVTVNAVNDAPVVSDIPDQTIDEGQSFTTINLDDYVSDVDNADAELTWTYSGNSELLISIDNNHVATISVPDSNWYGSETITFTATDPGGLSDGDAAQFTVNNVNDPPVVSDIPGQTIDEGGSFTQINLNDYVQDVDNSDSEISWVVHGNQYLEVNIDANNVATITTPDADWYGTDTLIFVASDPEGLQDSTQSVFTVNPVNDAPVVSDIPGQTVQEGEQFVEILLDNYVSDVDNADAEINWTYSGNSELQVNITSDHKAQIIIPSADWNGSEIITFTATDPGGLSDSDTARFEVLPVNDPPVAVDDSAVVDEDQSVTIQVLKNDSDKENDVLTVIKVFTPAHGSATLKGDSLILYQPQSNFNGNDRFDYVVSDGNGGQDTATVFVTINAVNDSPVISAIPDQQVEEGQAFSDIRLDDFVTDVEDADSLLVWSVSGNQHLQSTITSDRLLKVWPADENWNGSETLILTVKDTQGATDTDSVLFTVTPVNDAPVAVNDSLTLLEDAEISANLIANDLDVENDQLTLQSVGMPLHGKAQIQNGELFYQPDSNYFGLDSLHYTVSDGNGGLDSGTVFIQVLPVNDAPVANTIPDQTVAEGQTFPAIALDNYVQDVDDPDSLLNWTFYGNNALKVAVSAQRILFVEPPDLEWNGSETLTLIVADTAGLKDSLNVTFTVRAVNDTVKIKEPLPTIRFHEDDSLFWAVKDWFPFVEDKDNADSTLFFNVRGAKKVKVQKTTSGFWFRASENWFGKDTLWLTVSDGMAANSARLFMDVVAVNDPPYIQNLPDAIEFPNDTTYTLWMNEYGKDIDTPDSLLSWSFMVSNDSLKFKYDVQTTRLVLSAPQFSGTVQLICLLTDDSSATARDTITVRVTSATGLEDQLYSGIPEKYKLFQNFPNPFNPQTKIRFALPKAEKVKITVYNILGKQVAVIFEGFKPAGYHVVTFKADGLASGIYFYRLQTQHFSKVKKFILLR